MKPEEIDNIYEHSFSKCVNHIEEAMKNYFTNNNIIINFNDKHVHISRWDITESTLWCGDDRVR